MLRAHGSSNGNHPLSPIEEHKPNKADIPELIKDSLKHGHERGGLSIVYTVSLLCENTGYVFACASTLAT